MRHRRKGRRLGRSSSHRKAMMKNLASSLFLTERDSELDENAPKHKGRVVTTLHKAKEVRPLVERCITIARHSLPHLEAAKEFNTDAKRGTEQWKAWRNSGEWKKWNAAIAPAVAARRRAIQLLGDKQAVSILFDEVAPRFVDRSGGYTRILRLAMPRLGDAGQRAILELVGVHDRVARKSERPTFDDDAQIDDAQIDDAQIDDAQIDDAAADEDVDDEAMADESGSASEQDEVARADAEATQETDDDKK